MNIIHNRTKNMSKLYANIFESIENFPNWADWLVGKFVFSKWSLHIVCVAVEIEYSF